MVSRAKHLDPARCANETFALYSVPAFDSHVPETLRGSAIGSPKQLVEPEDVLLCRIVPHIRRAWVVEENDSHRLLASGEWIVFRGKAVCPSYLRHLLISNRFHAEFIATVAGVGGSLLRARAAHVARIEVPLPPLDEQRRIARILDAAMRLCAERESGKRLFDELRRVTFLKATLNPTEPRPTISVAELADKSIGGIRTGPFGSQLLHSEFVSHGIPVLGIDNAVTNHFRWGAERYVSDVKYQTLRRYAVHPGDVLITIMGTCGRAAIVPDDIGLAINTKHLCCISLDRSRCLPEFLHAYFLEHPVARQYLTSRAKGAIMAGLNMGIIKELPVPLPPIEVQQELVPRLREIDTLCAYAATHGAELNALFSSLQDRAFKSEL